MQHLNSIIRYRNLPDKVAIHINDTHPALCVPELMRLLIDEHDYSLGGGVGHHLPDALLHEPHRYAGGA